MGKVKDDFTAYLNHWVTFNHKEGCLDDETAEWLLEKATPEEAQKYIDEMDFKGDMAAEMWMEQEAEREAAENDARLVDKDVPLELTPEQEEHIVEEGIELEREARHEREG